MTLIGLGAKDNLEDAYEFVEKYGTTSFRMLCDATLESWTALEVRAQPTAILFDSDGRGQFIWYGPFDESEVLEKAAVL
ncbi:MAG: hypothetical protein V3W06_10750 [Acidimicrobiia bacterium]